MSPPISNPPCPKTTTEAGNADDPVLRSVEEHRRNSLVARTDPSQPGRYEWNVYLQGDNETVFFDL